MVIKISDILEHDLPLILATANNLWGGSVIVVHGDCYEIDQLPGFKAIRAARVTGFLHYEIRGDACEILTLASLQEGKGVGTALLNHMETHAAQNGIRLIHLTTTNDNLHALGFYQRRGYHIAAVFPGQIELSRKLKPSIPIVGENEIPIRDEIRLEKVLGLKDSTPKGNHGD